MKKIFLMGILGLFALGSCTNKNVHSHDHEGHDHSTVTHNHDGHNHEAEGHGEYPYHAESLGRRSSS